MHKSILALTIMLASFTAKADLSCEKIPQTIANLEEVKQSLILGSEQEKNVSATIELLTQALMIECNTK